MLALCLHGSSPDGTRHRNDRRADRGSSMWNLRRSQQTDQLATGWARVIASLTYRLWARGIAHEQSVAIAQPTQNFGQLLNTARGVQAPAGSTRWRCCVGTMALNLDKVAAELVPLRYPHLCNYIDVASKAKDAVVSERIANFKSHAIPVFEWLMPLYALNLSVCTRKNHHYGRGCVRLTEHGPCRWKCVCVLCGSSSHGVFQVHTSGKHEGTWQCSFRRQLDEDVALLADALASSEDAVFTSIMQLVRRRIGGIPPIHTPPHSNELPEGQPGAGTVVSASAAAAAAPLSNATASTKQVSSTATLSPPRGTASDTPNCHLPTTTTAYRPILSTTATSEIQRAAVATSFPVTPVTAPGHLRRDASYLEHHPSASAAHDSRDKGASTTCESSLVRAYQPQSRLPPSSLWCYDNTVTPVADSLRGNVTPAAVSSVGPAVVTHSPDRGANDSTPPGGVAVLSTVEQTAPQHLVVAPAVSTVSRVPKIVRLRVVLGPGPVCADSVEEIREGLQENAPPELQHLVTDTLQFSLARHGGAKLIDSDIWSLPKFTEIFALTCPVPFVLQQTINSNLRIEQDCTICGRPLSESPH
jgi:hypothetical protein